MILLKSTLAGKTAFLTILVILTVVSHASALPVHVTFEWTSGMPNLHEWVHVEAIQVAGRNAAGARVNAEATTNGMILNLGPGIWQVQASAPGYWSQESQVEVANEPVSAQIEFWPEAFLSGGVTTAGGKMLPQSLDVQLTSIPASVTETGATQSLTRRGDRTLSRAELHCRIRAGTWICPGPVGVFDLRIAAAGYAPHYVWGVSLKAAQTTDVGRTALRQAASIVGRVVRDGGLNPPDSCQAMIEPDMARRGPAERDEERPDGPNAKTTFPVALNERGFFQIIGVAPGRYVLAVGCRSASSFRQVQVQPESETRIDPPLILEDLTLDISVTPRTDPTGHSWKFAVYETGPHYLLIADGSPASADGRWIRHGLMAGNYRMVVSSSDGTPWLQEYFDLSKRTTPFKLNLSSVAVEGRVTLNSQPVHARLVFSNNVGGESAHVVSDENGRFYGMLPLAHGLDTSIWTIEAHLVEPPVMQRLLGVRIRPIAGSATWLDLDFPAIPVSGTVVSADGKPQRDVQVTLEDSRANSTTTATNNEGRFEMLSLPEGKYTARAVSRDGSSESVPFEVTQNGGAELKLVLTSFKRYTFYVVSSQGPVEGATVQIRIKPGVPRAVARTNDAGRFEVTLPPDTTEVGLTIGAPGYALKMVRVPIPNDDEPSDANTITLDDAAGSLALNVQPSGRSIDASGILYLVHNGAIQEALTIAGWGVNRAAPSSNTSAIIDAIEPGTYALCLVKNPAQLAAIWSGTLPALSCRTGSLESGDTLSLSPR